MSTESPAAARMRFGPFEADLATQELFEAGRRVRLPNQSFIALAVLLERAGGLVTREELRERVWPDNRVVEFEQGLNAVINRLRDALGDSADDAKYIETLPRRGYRFIAPVEAVPTPEVVQPSRRESPASAGAPLHPESPAPAGAPPSHLVSPAAPPPSRLEPPPQPSEPRARRLRATRLITLLVTFVLGIAVLSVVITSLVRQTWVTEPAPARRLVPFTSLLGQEVAPAFSPDGRQIAFAWNGESGSNGGFDLYTKAIDSESMLRLTHHPADALSAAWAPDGTRIAFARSSEKAGGLFLVPALGGPERRLAEAAFGYDPFMQLSWSPDSRLLAFSAFDVGGFHRIRLLRLDTLETNALQAGPECVETGAPAFAPDGRQLAFVCMTSVAVFSIYLADMPAGTPRMLASMHGYPRGLSWSADGARLILANDAGEGGALWEVTRNGRVSRLPFGEDATGPGVAVHGDRVAYVRGKQAIDIWRVDLAAPEAAEAGHKLIFSTRAQLMPQYSPDATRIVFQSSRSGSPEIWLADADGSNPERLTSFNGALTGAPVWCPDGRRIAFDSRASGTSGIYVMDVDERMPRQVKTDRENLSLPAWSEDCRWLFASDGKSSLYRIPMDGGAATRLTDQRAYYVSVGGDRVIFNAQQTKGVTLWSVDANGGAGGPLPGMPKLSYLDAWVATRSGVYFTRAESDAATLNFYDFTSQSTRRVMTLQQAPMALGGLGLSVSRDGRWLLYTRSGESQSDVLIAQSDQSTAKAK